MRSSIGFVWAIVVLLSTQILFAQSVLAQLTQGSNRQAPEQWTADVGRDGRKVPARWHFGFELFQMLLEESGLKLTQRTMAPLVAPTESVIVIVGDMQQSPYSRSQLLRFVKQGGALLLASDSGYRSSFGSISGNKLRSSSGRNRYLAYPDVLRVNDVDQRNPIMAGVSELVVNRSSWIDRVDYRYGTMKSVAEVPKNASPASSRGSAIVSTVSVHDSPASRVVMAADHSLFTNGMLWHGDNALFAINVCKYLKEVDRKQLIFIRDGRPQESFRLPNAPEAMPNIPPEAAPELTAEQLVQVLNKTVAKAEDADLINALITNRPRRIPTRYYHRGLLFALAAGLVAIALYYLLSKSQDITRPLAARQMRAPRAFGSDTIDTKNPDGVKRAEAARLIAASFMSNLTKSTDPALWTQYVNRLRGNETAYAQAAMTAESVPKLEMVLRAATSLDTKPISRGSLLEFNQVVDELSQLADHPRSTYPTS